MITLKELAARFYLYVCVKGNLEMALVTRLYTMSVYRETLRWPWRRGYPQQLTWASWTGQIEFSNVQKVNVILNQFLHLFSMIFDERHLPSLRHGCSIYRVFLSFLCICRRKDALSIIFGNIILVQCQVRPMMSVRRARPRRARPQLSIKNYHFLFLLPFDEKNYLFFDAAPYPRKLFWNWNSGPGINSY